MARFLNTQMAVVCVTLFLGYIFHYSLWLQPLELECWLRDSGVGGLCKAEQDLETEEKGQSSSQEPWVLVSV